MKGSVSRRGATLVELLVVLSVLAVAVGVVGLAASGSWAPPASAEPYADLAAARREAVATGRPVGVTVYVDRRPVDIHAWPDGSVRADTALDVDPLTGKHRATR